MVPKEDAEPILYEGTFNLNEKGEHRLAYNNGEKRTNAYTK
jgi:hypothetical protein